MCSSWHRLWFVSVSWPRGRRAGQPLHLIGLPTARRRAALPPRRALANAVATFRTPTALAGGVLDPTTHATLHLFGDARCLYARGPGAAGSHRPYRPQHLNMKQYRGSGPPSFHVFLPVPVLVCFSSCKADPLCGLVSQLPWPRWPSILAETLKSRVPRASSLSATLVRHYSDVRKWGFGGLSSEPGLRSGQKN